MSGLLPRVFASLLIGGLLASFAHADEVADFNALIAKGIEHFGKHQYEPAARHFEAALALAPRVPGVDAAYQSEVLNELGSVYFVSGRYAEAEKTWLRSLQIREAKLPAGDPAIADTLNNLAILYKDLERPETAEPYYLRALKIREAHFGAEHPEVADSLNNLAVLYQHLGRTDDAENLYHRALRIREKKLPANHPDTAAVLVNLGLIADQQRRFKAAEKLLLDGVAKYEATLSADDPAIARAVHNLAVHYYRSDQLAAAEPHYLRVLKIRRAKVGPEHPDTALVEGNLARLYRELGRFEEAEALAQHVLKVYQTTFGNDHPHVGSHGWANLAAIHLGMKQTVRATDEYDNARRNMRQYAARVLPMLSEREQLNFLSRIDRDVLEQALTIGVTYGENSAIAETAASWIANGKGLAQETLVQRAMLARDARNPQATEIARQLSAARARLAQLTNAAGRPDQAEARKAEQAALAAQEEQLAKQLQKVGGEGPPAKWVEMEAIRGKIPRASLLVDFIRFEPAVFDRNAKGPRWPPARFAVWLVPSLGEGDVRVIDLGEASLIEAAVATQRAEIGLCQSADAALNPLSSLGEPEAERRTQAALERLSKLVLQPLAAALERKDELILSPDGPLWLVPWSALPTGDGKYAVERWKIRYVSAARDLVEDAPLKRTNPPRILADPDFDLPANQVAAALVSILGPPPAPPVLPAETQFAVRGLRSAATIGRVDRLPGTAAEAAAIAPSLKTYAGESKTYAQQLALEGIFKRLVSPRVLVLSTHGFFLPDQEAAPTDPAASAAASGPTALGLDRKPLENPLLRCGLLLAGCNQRDRLLDKTLDDGVLTGMEIIDADLRDTELVVLSACETGLGVVNNGEGVSGLRQAFQLAGARSVVSTLWQVPDRDSAVLMSDFFANLAAGQAKAEALRGAQLRRIAARREKFDAAHPFYWAAWTLTGK